MNIKDFKCKCGENDFFFADKGNKKGIYCTYCGKWYKWADKDEQNLMLKEPAIPVNEIKELREKIADAGTTQFNIALHVSDLNERREHLKVGQGCNYCLGLIDDFLMRYEDGNN